MTDEYEKYADMLAKLIQRGFAAAVYTQTTDVEVEVNGLMTYDRSHKIQNTRGFGVMIEEEGVAYRGVEVDPEGRIKLAVFKRQLLPIFEVWKPPTCSTYQADPGNGARGELELLEETACSERISCRIGDGEGLQFRILQRRGSRHPVPRSSYLDMSSAHCCWPY